MEKTDEDDQGIGDTQIKLNFLNAVKGNDVEYIRYLLKLGVVDVNQIIGFDPKLNLFTALDVACQYGHNELVKVLIEELGADVSKVGDTGITPLFCACKVGNVEIAKILLKHGAKVDTGPEGVGIPPLVEAASLGDLEIIKILLEHGALKGSL